MKRFFKLALFCIAILSQAPIEAGAAPCLSQIWVSFIHSTNGQDEFPTPGQIASSFGHSGTSWTIITSEYGYGVQPITTLAGKALTLMSTQTIVDPTTNIAIGFKYTWSYSGTNISGGVITFSDTSANAGGCVSGYNNMSLSFNVQPYYAPPVFSSANQNFFSSAYGYSIRGTFVPPTPISYQFSTTDPNGSTITYSLAPINGKTIDSNIKITNDGLFTWDGYVASNSTTFIKSQTCPYPNNAQLYVVATDAKGVSATLLINLSSQSLPFPVCAPPPGGNN